MEKADGTPIYSLGLAIGQFLTILESPMSGYLCTPDSSAKWLLSNLEYFINQADSSAFRCSKDAAKNAVVQINNLLNNYKAGIGIIPELPKEAKAPIFASIMQFQSILTSELPKVNAFFINQHKDRDMNILINNGEQALSAKTLAALALSKDDVIREVREAARCLAFDLASAAGLHLCRAVESVIVKDYFTVLGLTPPKNRNLGRYIKVLEDTGKVNPKVISRLKDFKDYYRNVITHPDEYWDIDTADSAFGTAINVIDAIIRDVEDIKNKP